MASHTTIGPLKANQDELLGHRAEIRRLAGNLGLANIRIRDDGTLVVHSNESGYRAAARLASVASHLVGKDVHVITDDVPGAAGARDF